MQGVTRPGSISQLPEFKSGQQQSFRCDIWHSQRLWRRQRSRHSNHARGPLITLLIPQVMTCRSVVCDCRGRDSILLTHRTRLAPDVIGDHRALLPRVTCSCVPYFSAWCSSGSLTSSSSTRWPKGSEEIDTILDRMTLLSLLPVRTSWS